MKEEKDIDTLFKEGLKNPEIRFDEMHWAAMDKKLNKEGRRSISPIFWISTIAAIAAILTIVFLLNKPDQKLSEQTALQQKWNNGAKSQKAKSSKIPHLSNDLSERKNSEIKIIDAVRNGLDYKNKTQLNPVLRNEQVTDSTSESTDIKLLADIKSQKLAAGKTNVDYKLQKIKTEIGFKKSAISSINKTVNKPSLSLTFSVAPDLTSVKGSSQSSLSGGIGVGISLSLNNKLSISSGLAYAKKLYNSDFSLYKPNSNYVFKNQPLNIYANCDVLDIPINVNYKVLGNSRSSLIVTTGLSSYLMLKERYNYTYENEYTSGPKSYQVHNQNNHLLGVANVGVTFQHKINNKFAVGISPFMKIPLTEIGYGNSKLSSAGVAVSLNMMDVFKKK
ncbi:hypothetical protein QWY86_00140 [Pedobacter aquatilis]|uniref:hypothetical protein n=1 Tax=Pedobacter aquatilis TaxID=351343 RepID=UPI0025B2F813|nr:hypothetical protein [Pedobacter aquatilis]MDN3585063.1 hypothetical protein [Pedobacter aquatilis]